MTCEKILIVAFDGMDKELIEEFSLENIPQSEFGSIDNTTGISRRMTSELFASFITGETHEEHEVTGLKKELSLRERLGKWLFPKFAIDYIKGVHRLRSILTGKSVLRTQKYSKSDLEDDTLFDEIDASLPLYVPPYNPDPVWLLGFPHNITRSFSRDEWVKNTRWHTEARLEQGIGNQPAFFDISKEFWDFVMIHLHDPDSFQDTGIGDLEEEYQRLDDIAGEILDEYEDWTVIFMSDHGRPLEKAGPHDHNENAFYSCNRELFPEREPHITEFHDRILELTGQD